MNPKTRFDNTKNRTRPWLVGRSVVTTRKIESGKSKKTITDEEAEYVRGDKCNEEHAMREMEGEGEADKIK